MSQLSGGSERGMVTAKGAKEGGGGAGLGKGGGGKEKQGTATNLNHLRPWTIPPAQLAKMEGKN